MDENSNKPFNWNHAFKALMGMSKGIRHLHRQSIIHRDLRPENLLIAQDWVVKLGGFGLARFSKTDAPNKSKDTLKRIAGTPAFMAPEVFSAQGATQSSDIYSLSLTAWIIVTRVVDGVRIPPFKGNYFEISQQVAQVQARPPLATLKQNGWDKFFEKTWCALPEKRLSIDQVVTFLKELRPILIPDYSKTKKEE